MIISSLSNSCSSTIMLPFKADFMGPLSQVVSKPLVVFIAGVGTSLALLRLYRFIQDRSSGKETDYYETSSQLNEYLCLHFAREEELDFPDLLPRNGLEFPSRCAQVCCEHCSHRVRALDVGCAVGRSSFELARQFTEVIGVDYSQSFVDAGNQLVREGEMRYVVREEGECGRGAVARVDSDIDRDRVVFIRGDACDIPPNLGTFDCVLAANLICRLPQPLAFLTRASSLLNANGILVLTTPFTWNASFTPRDKWLGGTQGGDDSFTRLRSVLDNEFDLITTRDLPFLIKETRRKHQFTVSLCSVWRKK